MIDLPGCLNMRDLGGYRTRSGRQVARGRLFRSGSLGGLAGEAAQRVVGSLGLRRVIDLRTQREVEECPAAELPGHCTTIQAPLFRTIWWHWVAPADRSPEATARRYVEMLEEGAATVARVVDLLGDADECPTVIHCMAGRDRTGIVIACVLEVLGVPDAVIAEDYALSDALLDDGGLAHAETMLCMLELVRARHGSVRALLIERAATTAALDRLATALLVA